MNSKNFPVKRTIWYFVMPLAVLSRLLDANTIQLSGVCLLTLKGSLKGMLLRIGNKFSSVRLSHAANMKESYENMKVLLKKIQYENYAYY